MLVYILYEAGNESDPIGVYSSESYAQSDAIILNLKDWYILTRGYK
jgi:hypothetical protein